MQHRRPPDVAAALAAVRMQQDPQLTDSTRPSAAAVAPVAVAAAAVAADAVAAVAAVAAAVGTRGK